MLILIDADAEVVTPSSDTRSYTHQTVIFGQVKAPHHCDQLSQRSQVSRIAPSECSLREVGLGRWVGKQVGRFCLVRSYHLIYEPLLRSREEDKHFRLIQFEKIQSRDANRVKICKYDLPLVVLTYRPNNCPG